MFVHHPDPKHTGTVHVGSYDVEFKDGIAEVDQPQLLGRFRTARHAITETRRRPKDAAEATAQPDVEDTPSGLDD